MSFDSLAITLTPFMTAIITFMEVIFVVIRGVGVIPQTLRALIFAHVVQVLPSASHPPHIQRSTGSVM
jgi:hypothetical protein